MFNKKRKIYFFISNCTSWCHEENVTKFFNTRHRSLQLLNKLYNVTKWFSARSADG